MATSEVEICNSALIKLGAKRILTLDDDSKEARLCKEQYAKNRDELLRSHSWNFAIKKQELAKLTTSPAYEFDNEFQLPSDCLMVENTNLVFGEEWKIEGRKLLTNSDTIKITYRAKVENPSEFDPIFSEVLAMKIAHDISYAIVNSITLRQQMFQEYQNLLRHARSMDAMEGNANRQVVTETFVNERF